MAKKINITDKDQFNPVASTEVVADQIVKISAAMKQLAAGQLNRKAIVILVAEAASVGRTEVTKILDTLADLDQTYLNKRKGA